MAVSYTLKSGSLAALAASIAFVASPAMAQSPENQGRRWHGGAETNGGQQRAERQAQRVERQAQRAEQNPGWRAQQRAALPQAERSAPTVQAQPRWQGGERVRAEARTRGEVRGERGGNGWSGRTRTEAQAATQGWDGSRRYRGRADGTATTTTTAPPVVVSRDGNRWSDRNRDQYRRGDNTRYEGRTRGDNTYRDGRRYDGNRDGWRGDRRDGYRDGRHAGYRDGHRTWNRDWRRDNRYNWYSYRSANRNHYRLGSYYSPYRNYSYRRLSIGFHLDNLFFSSRYWISNPWSYRLPEVDGPYRWVRYYDDVLLVDIYSGEVVDVIHNFFW